MPNGYFLEGYVLVKNGKKHLVSLPLCWLFHGSTKICVALANLRIGSDNRFTTKTDYPVKKSQKRQSVIR